MGVASGMRAASSKCPMRSPEGPATVSFGKVERRVDKMSKPGPTEIGLVFTLGAVGGGLLGCSDCCNCQHHCWGLTHLTPELPALPSEIDEQSDSRLSLAAWSCG